MMFDGKKIRDEILQEIANKNAGLENKPILAEIVIGDDPVVTKYAELKKKMAENVGITFNIYQFDEKNTEEEIIECIDYLNSDPETNGIMIQIPVPEKFDRIKLIKAISPEKDVDGLRYCAGLESKFKPPVVLAILEAIKDSEFRIQDSAKITQIGHGFLVGQPLERMLKEQGISDFTVLDSKAWDEKNIPDSLFVIQNSDVLISAVGKPHLIKPEMIKENAILIDAGTAEESGELKGDIDPEAYKQARYYTPVPGGIGPVTIAMLFRNLTKD